MTTQAKELPPIEWLREQLDYNPNTGEMTWKQSNLRGGKQKGRVAGSYHKHKKRFYLRLNNSSWARARIAYAIYYGVDPKNSEVDHINRDTTDDRLCNLRLLDRRHNNINRTGKVNNTVKISYPDGRGVVMVNSVTSAAKLLNIHPVTLTRIAKKRDNQIYWDAPTSSAGRWIASGIKVELQTR